MKVRKEVMLFAEEMERKLRMNDHKGGWGSMSSDDAMNRLNGEIAEYLSAINQDKRLSIEIYDELIDIANFSMMAAQAFRKEKWNGSSGMVLLKSLKGMK